MSPERLPPFNEKIARHFVEMSNSMAGLPEYLGIRLIGMEPGRAEAELRVEEKLITAMGNMHGGVLSAFSDHLLACVCYPHMEEGAWAATTEFKVNLLAPVTGGTLRASATLVSMSKTTAVVRIDVENDGRPCSAAQGTVTLMRPRAKPRS
ncbi:MAG: phenylacetic acid degradation protein [Salinisphaeraceae bacterium]|jgi:uncharacterized protein (TIGR00369 family)|nr:phenylacetic acid degradation protein [Salinisphaeraceae bacterium]